MFDCVQLELTITFVNPLFLVMPAVSVWWEIVSLFFF